jgi:AI-2 transport protein TqsA
MNIEQDRADQRLRTVCLLILTVLAVGAALSLLRPVLVPFFLALLLTYCLTPVLDFLARYLRLPRGPALVVVGATGLLISLSLAYLTAAAVGEIAGHFEEYHDRLAQLTDRVLRALPRGLLGIKTSEEAERVFSVTEGAGRRILAELLGALTDLVSTGVLVVIFMIFLLHGRRGGAPDPASLLGEIEERVRRYIVWLVGVSALTGLLVGLVLAILGVPFAWVFGFLAFLLNFIPNVGAIIATLLPLPVVLLSPDLSAAGQVLAVVIPGAIQFLLGSLLQPRLFGGALDLHPVTVLIALLFFGMIWGVIGAFLAMPITGVIRIVFGRLPATRPLAALMEGDLGTLSRPAAADGPVAAKERLSSEP